MNRNLLLASRNQGKINEYLELVSGSGIQICSLADIALEIDVDEDGETFKDNAIKKALICAKASNMYTLADDSGLEVDALDSMPGVRTARYGGSKLTAADRYRLLLHEMEDTPWPKRTARFVCVIALADPRGIISTATGTCEGFIAHEASGSGGFGYDPVFYIASQQLTMAQLSAEEKHVISHRGQAFKKIHPVLCALFQVK